MWKLHNEEGGMVTILPILFENRVVDVLLSLKEIVNDIHEETLPQVNQEIQETAKEHFAGLLEVSECACSTEEGRQENV